MPLELYTAQDAELDLHGAVLVLVRAVQTLSSPRTYAREASSHLVLVLSRPFTVFNSDRVSIRSKELFVLRKLLHATAAAAITSSSSHLLAFALLPLLLFLVAYLKHISQQ
jgi:hypothetical protein